MIVTINLTNIPAGGSHKGSQLLVRLSAEDAQRVKRAARGLRLELAQFVRAAVVRSAERVLDELGPAAPELEQRIDPTDEH